MGFDDLPLFRSPPPHEPNTRGETSRAAAVRVARESVTLAERVYRSLRASAGLTSEEIGERIGRNNQTVTPRIRDLVLQGWVRDGGEKRPSSRGTPMTVWVALERQDLANAPRKRIKRPAAPRLDYRPNQTDRRILAVIEREGGLSSDEVEWRTGIPHQTVSAQIAYLHGAGLLRDSGRRTKSRSGCWVMVWVLA